MTPRQFCLLIAVCPLFVACGQTRRPPELVRVIQVVDSIGLLRTATFVDSVRAPASAAALRPTSDSASFFALPRGADSVIVAGGPFVVAIDRETRFALYAYYPAGKLRLVQVLSPFVNGDQRQARLMLATVHSVATSLGGRDVSAWIDSSWQDVWHSYYRAGHSRADILKERLVGGYLFAVSGVPPDFIYFAALRRGS